MIMPMERLRFLAGTAHAHALRAHITLRPVLEGNTNPAWLALLPVNLPRRGHDWDSGYDRDAWRRLLETSLVDDVGEPRQVLDGCRHGVPVGPRLESDAEGLGHVGDLHFVEEFLPVGGAHVRIGMR
jgi:hypothetical protein